MAEKVLHSGTQPPVRPRTGYAIGRPDEQRKVAVVQQGDLSAGRWIRRRF